MSSAEELERELAALVAEREAKAAAREEALRVQRLAAKVERAKKDLANDELFAKLSDEHADRRLGRVHTPSGDMVVVVAPVGIVYQRLVDDVTRTDERGKARVSLSQAAERAARECVIHPDRAKYNALAEECAPLAAKVLEVALELGKAEAVDDAGK